MVPGAFGCGAFAPSHPPDFAKQVAEIYQDLLTDKYDGVFDKVEFALPSFVHGGGMQHGGKKSAAAMGDANYLQFRQVFSPKQPVTGIRV